MMTKFSLMVAVSQLMEKAVSVVQGFSMYSEPVLILSTEIVTKIFVNTHLSMVIDQTIADQMDPEKTKTKIIFLKWD